MLKAPKISLIGSGNIGGSIAYLITQKFIAADIVLLDRDEGIASGKALDIGQSSSFANRNITIKGSANYEDIKDSDVIIVTAGLVRLPGMSRNDLLDKNTEIIKTVGSNIKKYAPHSFVIVITNPLDAMVWVMQKITGFDPKQVVGMAGVLDSARFNYLLSKEFNVSVSDVRSFVLGGHGDSMVPLVKYSSIGGIPVLEMIKMGFSTETNINDIVERVRKGGAEIIALLQKGSAFYAPASSAIEMAESYIYDSRKILTCACYLSGEYGYRNLYAGVPCIIGKNGVEKIIEVSLTEIERNAFNESIDSIHSLIAQLKNANMLF